MVYRQPYNIMGLFGIFGPRTKADIDREIAELQGEVERLKAAYASAKLRQGKISNVNTNPAQYPPKIANVKAKIAKLKAERKNAPK